jgi:hypothetical protein
MRTDVKPLVMTVFAVWVVAVQTVLAQMTATDFPQRAEASRASWSCRTPSQRPMPGRFGERLLRFYLGLEDPDDLIGDLQQAFHFRPM